MNWFLVRETVNFPEPYNQLKVGQIFPGKLDPEPLTEIHMKDVATHLDIYQPDEDLYNHPVAPHDHDWIVHKDCVNCMCDPQYWCRLCQGLDELEEDALDNAIWIMEERFICDWVWIQTHFGHEQLKMRQHHEVVPVEWNWIMDVLMRGDWNTHRLARDPTKDEEIRMHYIRSRGIDKEIAEAMVGLRSFEPKPDVLAVLNRKAAGHLPYPSLESLYS